MSNNSQGSLPFVSIIIPYYNGEEFIEEAIESVINQSFSSWELIIVDDGSPNPPEKIIAEYVSNNQIKYIRHNKNKGIAQARNTGIKNSKGTYVAFLDQDDIWLDSKLKEQVAIFENTNLNIGMVCTGMYFITSAGKICYQFDGFDSGNQKEMIKNMFLQITNSGTVMMVKKECMNETGFFDDDYYAYDDFDFWIRMAASFNIQYINRPLAKKRLHQSNVSLQKLSVLVTDALKAVSRACEIHPFLMKYRNKALSKLYCRYGLNYLFHNNFPIGQKYLKKAIRFYSLCWKAYLFFLFSLFGKSGIHFLCQMRSSVNMQRLYGNLSLKFKKGSLKQ